jgi:hypothetical protein
MSSPIERDADCKKTGNGINRSDSLEPTGARGFRDGRDGVLAGTRCLTIATAAPVLPWKPPRLRGGRLTITLRHYEMYSTIATAALVLPWKLPPHECGGIGERGGICAHRLADRRFVCRV